jgi:homoserine O-acetyltransferase
MVPSGDLTAMTSEHLRTVTFGSFQEPFRLLAGGTLPEVTIAYECWGELSPARDNLVLITTGISASPHVARHGPEDEPGWWEEMIGPGRPIDTDRLFVVCTNVLGGCFGSTGPTSINPATGRPYGVDFPLVNVEDMVEAQTRVLDHFGVERALTVIGSSLGGMVALQWGAQRPERLRSLCAMAAPGRAYAYSIAWRAVQRNVVMSDPDWKGGRYAPGKGPVAGMRNARAIGILSYRSPLEFDVRFGRDFDADAGRWGRFSVESYLTYNAEAFGQRFDANSYLTLARAMDLFDLGRGAPTYEAGVARIVSPCLIVGFTSDQLFPIHQQRELAIILDSHERPVRYEEIDTIHGHDTFLIEIDRLGRVLVDFFRSVARSG